MNNWTLLIDLTLKLTFKIHLINAEFKLIKKQLWTIFMSNLQ